MATFEVPGAYLHADITTYKRLLLKIRRGFVDNMCQVNPEYEQQVRYEHGGKVLCLLVLRDIYVFKESSLL